ncbi:paraquat-inducible protein A [Aestuariirhabdus sp. Z084]|uniref:paraquat-inducible protein A n=1 Tax=Aestuariirhabdus haliotis TaxID=2918751 RepID=UPI00201B3745|nr:paraquat-inducible protein A [Aestuariirhabdus haliotis]MCL6414503.1 paraquat-inducible protein A [Aestuariirhabdus haliotis]MCL6418515.1 paraquat-inducible protein A [Aestuariirhabdus haliotis]
MTPPFLRERPLTACHECDLLLQPAQKKLHQIVRCPRCGYKLYQHKPGSTHNTIALALAGVVFFIPANTLPIMSMELFGQTHIDTMLTGVTRLFDNGHWWISGLVLLCSVIFPLMRLVLALLVLIPLQLGRSSRAQIEAFKLYHHLSSWSMLEVYMIGILVAIIKLANMAMISPGYGLICFTGLMLCTIGLSQTLDEHTTWDLLEKYRHD